VYTKPDETHNRATFVNAALRHAGPAGLAFSGNVYYRDIDTGPSTATSTRNRSIRSLSAR
jgi:hypothetical protein